MVAASRRAGLAMCLDRLDRKIELRGDFFNAFNRKNLASPVTDLSNANFGRITGQGAARTIQLGFRAEF